MSTGPRRAIPKKEPATFGIATLQAMAMFVLGVETSLMPT
jgi:hypothetical protein